ncbi:type II toxin-antitoxin system RelE/ParE family toxin [Listeria monocytogenes]|uniref:type II toxin-antitoxin system RelE family toxin n=1 Tax=Listeria monocytogenes TaxID=1639 RepID=UPI0010BABC82|nr:type II toxin-antitoxin system RelE/ParE family toxin [Listeria monocytogenes]EAC3456864.1 type II toxin-antitoxin system RelE/ParE family toxin [Listeria monocytogenes]EAC4365824.1 type II toxin-antitoxin system RelE/ParE family toxin [Listeria monocytogenes]EAC4831117.1 type II toxin-antitoxin system RelE/ParE family toxin [Listeria monocytogenes]EAC6175384.1 type II toxin-antitoxin system RelE/ParE family toxin [Listeria monocytogenes]EAC7892571.1 type II toxin-antitoxin system RelE/ParE
MSKHFHVRFEKEAQKVLKKMDRFQAKLILSWIEKHIEGSDNPRQHGKSLVGNRVGQWRYRVGDYRLIAEIQDNEVIVLILNIGHRRDIYDK